MKEGPKENHKDLYMREAGDQRERDSRRWGDVSQVLQAPLEADKIKLTDSPLEPPEGTCPATILDF